MDKRGDMLFEGRPFFTDSALYNSYDFCGAPLGLFEKGSPRLAVDVGYRYAGWGDGSGHYLSGQSFTMGNPDHVFFRVFYGPDILSHKNGGNEASLALHRFGFMAAAQGTDGTFRSSILADGFYGGQKWAAGDSSRSIMGFERLRFDVGSQLHSLVRLGLFFGVIGRVDTLDVPEDTLRQDRSGQINLPEFGGSLDFGGEGMPFHSIVTFSYALSRFVYTSKPAPSLFTVPPIDSNGNASVITNDSFNLFWMTRMRVPVNESGFTFNPGLLVGYTENSGEMRNPSEDNSIINIGDVRSTYKLSGIWFGAGTGFEAQKYADIHVEYALSDMSLTVDPDNNPGGKRSRVLHHVSMSVSSKLNEFVEIPVTLVPRLGYFASGTAGLVGERRLSLDPLNIVPGKSKAPLYSPELFLEGFERVSGFTIGLDAKALEERLNASIWTTILSSSVEGADGGLEFGLRVGFAVK